MDREDEWELPKLMAAMPGVCEGLLNTHVADANGRCRGCDSQVRIAERWPCTLYRAAEQGRRIAAG